MIQLTQNYDQRLCLKLLNFFNKNFQLSLKLSLIVLNKNFRILSISLKILFLLFYFTLNKSQ